VLQYLAPKVDFAVGIDTSMPNIECGQEMLKNMPNCRLLVMDAVRTGFRDGIFDCVVCIQNGISAFGVDQRTLICESVRITRGGGLVLFSSYSPRIWSERLRWFELQATAGLIGEIDRHKTREGVIVCKDGFIATTVDPQRFYDLTAHIPAEADVEEVDASSIFFSLRVHQQS
jgi:ubiquinone/menaquinone biosynthesis C-methylase UbiE